MIPEMSNGVTPATPKMRMGSSVPAHCMVNEVIGLVHTYGACGTSQVLSTARQGFSS